MPVITCIEDLKRLHQKRTPKMFWDYCESGSYTEQTFRENSSDFAQIRFRQRVARDLSGRVLESTMAGQKVTMPVALSPVGSTGMQHPDGEILAARAAARFGVPYTLSTMSICSIEDVAPASPDPFWFQLYVMTDEDFVDAIIERARKANCSALILTLDLQILGQRHKDRPVSGFGLCLHAEVEDHCPAPRRDGARFRLHHSHRHRRPGDRRAGQP